MKRLPDDNSIAFIDAEIDPVSKEILDIGCIRENQEKFHNRSITSFVHFLNGTRFICGHNILNHDLKYLSKKISNSEKLWEHVIDTLYLSPLLFPSKPYHKLLKDDKLYSEELNNPLNDSIKAKELFNDEVFAF